jgi:NAD(P)-dependent dehydrogenase (short-subunit alcohol dehydrogenase family)
MNLGLQDKVMLVSGGAKGIGEAITRGLAEEGAVACILGRNREEAERLVAELGASGQRADAFLCEMTDEAAVRAVASAALSKYGRIDGVINNAGVNDKVGLRATTAEFRSSLEKNVVHAFVLVQACVDALIASRGCVVNIGTKCASTGQGGTSGYVAAKGALHALTREWALDLAPHGVRVNCVIPAEVMTPLYARLLAAEPDPAAARQAIERMIPLEHRFTTAQEIADMAVFLASPRSAHTTGQLIYVDGGYTHLDRAVTAAR